MGLKFTRQTDLQKFKILRSCAIKAGHIRRDDKSIASHKGLRRLLFALQSQLAMQDEGEVNIARVTGPNRRARPRFDHLNPGHRACIGTNHRIARHKPRQAERTPFSFIRFVMNELLPRKQPVGAHMLRWQFHIVI